ncbi:MAG: type II toxin-antitoxin system PemK/MazF family toxin [Verrucomicrobia bacterium]|nr:type II toxin-antitoxin system PemK/MazF family toxin [Verrucomicrobiota bacterium]
MKTQFEVWDCDFEKKGLHPAVLISHPDRCVGAKSLNVLFCTSQRQSRQPYPFEVALDTVDGMDWETFCDCSILWSIEASRLTKHRGMVTLERRRAIRSMIRDMFRLAAMD